MTGLSLQRKKLPMQLVVVQGRQELGAAAAKVIAEQVRANPRSVLGIATGASPLPVYAQLAADSGTDYRQTTCFALDEYVGLAAPHPRVTDSLFGTMYQVRWESRPNVSTFPTDLRKTSRTPAPCLNRKSRQREESTSRSWVSAGTGIWPSTSLDQQSAAGPAWSRCQRIPGGRTQGSSRIRPQCPPML